MAKRTPGTGTWLGLGSVPLQGSDGPGVSGYWGWLWSYAPLGRRAASSDMAAGPPSALGSSDRPGPSLPDSAAGSAPASLDTQMTNPASAAPQAPALAAGSTSVSRSGNQNIDGVLSGVKWNGP